VAGDPDAVATIGPGNLLLAGPAVSDVAAVALVGLLVDHTSGLVPGPRPPAAGSSIGSR